MADLEEHAIKRDKRFVVRLVLLLAIAVLVGLIIFAKMTSRDTADCAAGAFGGATSGSEPAPASE